MTQPTTSSDALAKTSSLLGGLLSQMGGALGAHGKGDLFASLLGKGDLSAALDLHTQTNQSKNTNFVTASAATTTTAAPATTNNDTTDSNDTDASADVMQNLRSIAKTLQKIMAGLRQGHQSHSHAKAKTADTQDASDAATTGATTDTDIASDTTAAQAAQTSTDDSTDPAKTIADIIAELLAMTQLMMQMLHQTQIAGNSATATDASNQLISDLQAAGGATLGKGLLELAKALQILNNNKRLDIANGITNAAQDDSGSDSSPTGNVLLDLLKTIEKNALELWPIPADSSTVADANDTNEAAKLAATLIAASKDKFTEKMSAQLDALDKTLKQVVAGLEQQITGQTGVTQAVTQLAQTAKNNAQNAVDALTAHLPSMGPANVSDPDPQSAVPDAVQNRLYPLTPAPAPTAHAHAATQAQVQAQQNASLQPADNKTETTPSVNASAIAMAAKQNATGSTNDDMLSDHQASFSHDTAAQNFNGGLNGESVQSNGNYNFASTLATFRAANAGPANMPTPVDQIILQMSRNLKNGNDQLTLQLHPADLGKITVKLDVGSDGKVQGTVTADNPKTLDMLQKDSRSLERALQDAGLRADSGSLQFNLGHQQNQGQAGQTGDGQKGDSDGATGTINADKDLELVDMSGLQETYYITPSGVNIRV